MCAKSGFNPGSPGWLYLLFHDDWRIFQIGTSNVPEDRLKRHRQNGWRVLELKGPMDGYLTANLERSILTSLRRGGAVVGRRGHGSAFDGYTESWTEISLVADNLKQTLAWVYEDEGTNQGG